MACRHVLLLERSPALRDVLQVVCAEDGLDVRVCPSLTDLWTAATGQVGEVALVDEHEVDGLLAEEHGGDLGLLSRRVPLVLIADSRVQCRTAEDLGVEAVVPKPFDISDLLSALHHAADKYQSGKTGARDPGRAPSSALAAEG
jgi:CheY-like chemotaxis protein